MSTLSARDDAGKSGRRQFLQSTAAMGAGAIASGVARLAKSEAQGSLVASAASPGPIDCPPALIATQAGPAGPVADVCARLTGKKAAKMLKRLTAGRVRVIFSPDTYIDGDEEGSMGHVYTAWLCDEADSEIMSLDDRQPNLQAQLADEMDRVAAVYAVAAADLRAMTPATMPRRLYDRFDILLVSPSVGWHPIDWQDVPAVYSTTEVLERKYTRPEMEGFLFGYNCAAVDSFDGRWAVAVPAGTAGEGGAV